MVVRKVRRLKLGGKIFILCGILLVLISASFCLFNFFLFRSKDVSKQQDKNVIKNEY